MGSFLYCEASRLFFFLGVVCVHKLNYLFLCIQEDVNKVGVEVRSPPPSDYVEALLQWHCVAVAALLGYGVESVSYTHLDVYKRQSICSSFTSG